MHTFYHGSTGPGQSSLTRICHSFQQEGAEGNQGLLQAFLQGHAELVPLHLLVIQVRHSTFSELQSKEWREAICGLRESPSSWKPEAEKSFL